MRSLKNIDASQVVALVFILWFLGMILIFCLCEKNGIDPLNYF